MADLTDLRAIPAAHARLDAAELELIDRARRAGATWADIAAALGLSSRQAAEQRRWRLATAAAPRRPGEAYGESIAALRSAAMELRLRTGADRRWDGRFTRAALVRETLAAAPDAPAGALFSLVEQVVADLAEAFGPEGAAGARRPLPGPTRAAVERLRRALADAVPHHS